MCVYTLTGHFIRYILLVPGWTPFCLQNCLNSSWHKFNKVLETFLRDLVHNDMIASRSCCRFVGCTSMMRISRSTTSQRCSIGFRSGDCHRPAQFSLNSICAINSVILLEMKFPQLSKPEATTARNQNSIRTVTERRNQAQSGGQTNQ